MSFPVPNLIPALPELFLLGVLSLILIADLFIAEGKKAQTYILTQTALLMTVLVIVVPASSKTVLTFSDMYVDDAMSDTLKVLACLSLSVMLVFSRAYLAARGLLQGEFFVLILFALLGMMVMISAHNFLTLYLGLELLTLSSYALVALQRDSKAATEAAMKYFVLGALASGLLLYGLSMIYGATGSLDVAKVAEALQQGVDTGNKTIMTFGLVFVVAGLAFKLGVVPFHMWIPDVYHGAPTAVTLFIGSAPKIAAFAFFMRLLVTGMQPLSGDWQGMLVILAILSMALGNIAAIAQTNIKRMLAYSTISHMGFVLIGILAANSEGYSSAMFYMLAYVLMSLGAFGIVMLLSRRGFEADNLDDLKGLNQRNPWYAAIMLLVMFSMAGIPPTVGFFAKLAVLKAALAVGFTWLVVVAVMLSLIGAFYYLRIVKLMYFDAPTDNSPIEPQIDAKVLLSANGLAVLALGILPQPLMALCIYSIQHSLQ